MNHKDIVDLLKAAAVNWVHDYAQSMGAALAFYTMFSIAPLLLIVISIAGMVFGEASARGEIFSIASGGRRQRAGTPVCGGLCVPACCRSG